MQACDGFKTFARLPCREYFRCAAALKDGFAINEEMHATIAVIPAKARVVGCAFITVDIAAQCVVMGRYSARAAQRPASRVTRTGSPNVSDRCSEVSTSSVVPAAITRASRSRAACVVEAGSSSRWWVT